jgi:ADP-heptose:LPS heptosyltransferase
VDFECLKPIFFAGKLTLPETGYALSFAKATISNDSGLAHLSESVNTPVAVLFGPTVEAFGFAPRMKQSKSFSSDLGCRPCSKHGQIACRFKDQRCFHDVSVDKVVEHIWELIL